MAKKKNNNRSFSYESPVLYNGTLYPSAQGNIVYGDGQQRLANIFTDAYGNYFTLNDKGQALPAMLTDTLPEVVVTPSRQEVLSNALAESTTLGNDNTMVLNSPHRAYNPYLKNRSVKGAQSHALWEKEHPNLSSWAYAASAVPFAVASAPFIGAAGQALANTAVGQAAINGASTFFGNPIVSAVNDGLSGALVAKGLQDISKGKFTPETALDLTGMYPLFRSNSTLGNVFNDAKSAFANRLKPLSPGSLGDANVRTNVLMPTMGQALDAPTPYALLPSQNHLSLPSPRPAAITEQQVSRLGSPVAATHSAVGLDNDVDAYVDSFFTHTPSSSSRTALSSPPQEIILQPLPAVAPAPSRTAMPYSPGEVPDDAFNPFRGMTTAEIDAKQQRAWQDAIREQEREEDYYNDAVDALNIGREDGYNSGLGMDYNQNHIDSGSSLDDMDNWSDANLGLNPSKINTVSFKARDTRKGELPYTDEEINALINPDGTLKKEVVPMDFVNTGAHGVSNWYRLYDEPKDVLNKYLKVTDPTVARREMQSIMRENPTGRSGIIINTHSDDTSIDSTPLAYKMATRLGKKFRPLEGAVDENSFLVPKQYKEKFTKDKRVMSNSLGISNFFKQGYGAEANRARVLYKANPGYEATLLRDADGNMTAFELTDENGIFQIPLNSRQETLDIMNKQLHKFNDYYGTSYPDIEPMYDSRPWYFGESFSLPNIYGIIYKKGGKLKKKRGLTF